MMRIDRPPTSTRVKAANGKIASSSASRTPSTSAVRDDVDLFYGLGQRVSQLTYNTRNMIGNGSTERRDEGISDFGVAIVSADEQGGHGHRRVALAATAPPSTPSRCRRSRC